ncbi:probable sugar phosphate/phosphate translocator At3g11320 [Rutidosis leptorrhynchoides]|uniref:probable sugar phosphate/phosphate translocator At3g11320 n=1 Tax=Rutidosis leptorrhynchoides TaxID=125765 RepID=UPI003A98FE5A
MSAKSNYNVMLNTDDDEDDYEVDNIMSAKSQRLKLLNLLLYMAPISITLLLPVTMYMEENVVGVQPSDQLQGKKHTSALTLQRKRCSSSSFFVDGVLVSNPFKVTGMARQHATHANAPREKRACFLSGVFSFELSMS